MEHGSPPRTPGWAEPLSARPPTALRIWLEEKAGPPGRGGQAEGRGGGWGAMLMGPPGHPPEVPRLTPQ